MRQTGQNSDQINRTPLWTKSEVKKFKKYGTLHEFACHPCAQKIRKLSVKLKQLKQGKMAAEN